MTSGILISSYDTSISYTGVSDSLNTTRYKAVAHGLLYKIKSRNGTINYYGTNDGTSSGKLYGNFRCKDICNLLYLDFLFYNIKPNYLQK